MALSDAYATPQAYRMRIHKDDQTEDEDLQQDLIAVSRYLERCLKQFFNRNELPESRIYMPIHSSNPRAPVPAYGWAESENPWRYLRADPNLDIDPIYDTTGLLIEIDSNRDGTFSTVMASNEYVLLPRNAARGPEVRPYTVIQARWFTNSNAHWMPYAEVRVTGLFGWSEVPAAIERATIDLTSILRIESPRATNRVSELEGTIGVSREGQAILSGLQLAYKRPRGF